MPSANIILCPASNAVAQRNYELSVEKPVPVPSALREQLGTPPQVRVWATASRTQWIKAKSGDVLLFFRAGTAYALAECNGTGDSSAFASSVWGAPEWQYLFFLAAPRSISIPVPQLNATLGYSERYLIRQLAVLKEAQSAAVAPLLRT